MSLNSWFLSIISLLFTHLGQSQETDCILKISEQNKDMLIDLFQLNSEQQQALDSLQHIIVKEGKQVNLEIQTLLDEHPQSTQDELIKLASKYNLLKRQAVNFSKEMDSTLLTFFNKKQYSKYITLCNEVFRKPIPVTPKEYDVKAVKE